MKVQQWQGSWQQQQLEVQVLPRLMLTEVRLLVDGEERDRSVLFRSLKEHRLCALAKPELRQGLIEVSVGEAGLGVAVDGASLTEPGPDSRPQGAKLALNNGLLCALGFFVMVTLFMLLFGLFQHGFGTLVLPSPTPPLVLALVMGVYYFVDTKKRMDFRRSLKKAP